MQYVEPENNCENDFLLELTEPRNKKYEYYETNEKYLKWRDFITNGNLKLLRFPSGEKYIIGVKDTVDTGFDIRAKNTPSVVKFSWIELESVDDKSTLLFKK